MKKHYETHVEDTDKLISVAGPVLDYKSWYEQYRKLMEEQAQRKYGLYTPTSEGDDDFPSISGMIARYSALGLTNEQMAENPVWKDLTGNGYDLQMKNFLWARMSGVGGYSTRQSVYKFTPDIYTMICVGAGVTHMSFTFKVTGLKPDTNLTLMYAGTSGQKIYGKWTEDGIYSVDSEIEHVGQPVYFYNGYGSIRDTFTIEIFPLYPGALVFDGVDDYGICENFPILTKEKGYTVVALRQFLSLKDAFLLSKSKTGLANTDGAFSFERNNTNPSGYNFGKGLNLPIVTNPFSYQTSKLYNGTSVKVGDAVDSNILLVCSSYVNSNKHCNAAIWEIVILDHDATEEELTKIKDYFVKTYPWLFPDQAWTVTGKTNEDEDRATIANITGNGNDLVLSNFGFAENSGYGLYGQNFNKYGYGNLKTITYQKTARSIELNVPAGSSGNIYSNSDSNASIGYVYDFKIKVTGLKVGNLLSITKGSSLDNIVMNINQDGVYAIKEVVEESWDQKRIYFWIRNSNGPETILFIEQIPEYEGYLVTDGVDDKIQSSAFTMGKDFTVVGEWVFMGVDSINYAGFIKDSSFILYNYFNYGEINVYIKSLSGYPVKSKTLKGFSSNGQVYIDFNNLKEIKYGDSVALSSMLNIGYNPNNESFTKLAFKNLAIYPTVLSKEDCIKAYNYLQTLKAK